MPSVVSCALITMAAFIEGSYTCRSPDSWISSPKTDNKHENCGKPAYYVSDFQTTFEEAESFCKDLCDDSHLTTILADYEQTAIRETLQNISKCTTSLGNHLWIGLKRDSDRTRGYWIHTPRHEGSFRSWEPSLVKNGTIDKATEQCCAIQNGQHYSWSPVMCSEKLRFICKRCSHQDNCVRPTKPSAETALPPRDTTSYHHADRDPNLLPEGTMSPNSTSTDSNKSFFHSGTDLFPIVIALSALIIVILMSLCIAAVIFCKRKSKRANSSNQDAASQSTAQPDCIISSSTSTALQLYNVDVIPESARSIQARPASYATIEETAVLRGVGVYSLERKTRYSKNLPRKTSRLESGHPDEGTLGAASAVSSYSFEYSGNPVDVNLNPDIAHQRLDKVEAGEAVTETDGNGNEKRISECDITTIVENVAYKRLTTVTKS